MLLDLASLPGFNICQTLLTFGVNTGSRCHVESSVQTNVNKLKARGTTHPACRQWCARETLVSGTAIPPLKKASKTTKLHCSHQYSSTLNKALIHTGSQPESKSYIHTAATTSMALYLVNWENTELQLTSLMWAETLSLCSYFCSYLCVFVVQDVLEELPSSGR